MSRFKRLSIAPSEKERAWGFLYLVFGLFVLPWLLRQMNGRLAQPISSAWLNFLYFALNFSFLLVIFRNYLSRSLAYAGQHLWTLLSTIVPGFCVYWVCNFLLSYVILQLYPAFSNINDQSIAQISQGNFYVMAVGTVFLVPAAEELLHRGLVFGTLHRKNRVAAYCISCMVFAAVHVLGYLGSHDELSLLLSFLQYLPAGLILAWAYEKSGCIFAPMVIHTAINALGIYALRIYALR